MAQPEEVEPGMESGRTVLNAAFLLTDSMTLSKSVSLLESHFSKLYPPYVVRMKESCIRKVFSPVSGT